MTTSGLYLGSATAMWIMPSIAAMFGPGSLFKVCLSGKGTMCFIVTIQHYNPPPQINGVLGLSWAALWAAVSAANPAAQQGFIPVTTADTPASSKGPKAQGTSTPWRLLLTQPAVWAIVVWHAWTHEHGRIHTQHVFHALNPD